MNTDYKLRWYHNLYPFGFHLISFLIVWLFYYGGRTMIFRITEEGNYVLVPIGLLYHAGYILLFCLMCCLAYKQNLRLYPRCLLFASLIVIPALFLIEFLAMVASPTEDIALLGGHVFFFCGQAVFYIVLCLAVTIGAGRRRFYRKFSKGPLIILLFVMVIPLYLYIGMYSYYNGLVAHATWFGHEYFEYIYGKVLREYLLLGTMVQAILFPCIFLIIKYTTRPKEAAEAAKKQKAARTAETSGTAPNPEQDTTSSTS